MQAVALVEDHVQGIYRNAAFYDESAFFGLHGFYREVARLYISARDRTEPLFGQGHGIFETDVSGYGQDGVVRRIETEEEILHFVQRGVFDVTGFLTDGWPLIRVILVYQTSYQVPDIAIRLVQVTLLELFDHYIALYLEAPFAEIEREHAVAFQPETYFHVLTGKGDVVVGDVVVGPRIVFSTGALHVSIIVWNVYRATEHQVLEEVGKAGVFGVLVACSHVVKYVQRYHLCIGIFAVYDAQAVFEGFAIDFNHNDKTFYPVVIK